MAYKYTVSLPSRALAEEFKRACVKRGHSQSHIITSAIRYFVSHPYSHGFDNGEIVTERKAEGAKKRGVSHRDNDTH